MWSYGCVRCGGVYVALNNNDTCADCKTDAKNERFQNTRMELLRAADTALWVLENSNHTAKQRKHARDQLRTAYTRAKAMEVEIQDTR